MSIDINAAYKTSLQLKEITSQLYGETTDPWEFENYRKCISLCLNELQKHFSPTLSPRILREASCITKSPLFYFDSKIIEYSSETQRQAKLLTIFFDRLCTCLDSATMRDFEDC